MVDEGVMRGSVNWQLYGSKKPGYEPYKLKYIYETCLEDTREMEIKYIDPCKEKFDFFALSVRSTKNCVQFEIKPLYIEAYQKHKSSFHQKRDHKVGGALKIKKRSSVDSLANIQSLDDIKTLAENMMDDPDVDYSVKEIHRYTMSLPKEFWGPGSYTKWIKTGWALKNTHEKLLLTWLKFSSQSDSFSYSDISSLCDKWDRFTYGDINQLTNRSIIYWVREICEHDFWSIRAKTVDYFITESIRELNEVNVATVLYHLYKDKYVCVGIKDDTWYEFINHKWEPVDSGTTLRYKISNDLFNKYIDKSRDCTSKLNTLDSETAEWGKAKEFISKITICSQKVKSGSFKNAVMREAKELFFDKLFWNKIDTNPYLMCFNNGVLDFEKNHFRPGKPEDYISKSTLIDYIPLSEISSTIISEVNDFMKQLFPDTIIYNDWK